MLTADLDLLAKFDVDYVTLPGWNTSIMDITSYNTLPENCRKYIEFIEASLGVPVEWIRVGPGRNSRDVQSWAQLADVARSTHSHQLI